MVYTLHMLELVGDIKWSIPYTCSILTHSCLRVILNVVARILDTFDNNGKIKKDFREYLMEQWEVF